MTHLKVIEHTTKSIFRNGEAFLSLIPSSSSAVACRYSRTFIWQKDEFLVLVFFLNFKSSVARVRGKKLYPEYLAIQWRQWNPSDSKYENIWTLGGWYNCTTASHIPESKIMFVRRTLFVLKNFVRTSIQICLSSP